MIPYEMRWEWDKIGFLGVINTPICHVFWWFIVSYGKMVWFLVVFGGFG